MYNHQKHAFTFHTYTNHMKEMLHNMHTSSDFTDVTLICDDKTEIKAHKHVLSVCSPVFKNILTQENNHPVIYLSDIKYCEMEPIMQFMYLGEARIEANRMNLLLSAVKSLQIREFANTVVVEESTDHKNGNDLLIHKSLSKPIIKSAVKRKYQCNGRSYNGKEQEVTGKVDVKKSCNECDYLTSSNNMNALTNHIQSNHVHSNRMCDKCGYKASQPWILRKHVQRMHEYVLHNCPNKQCDYQTKHLSKLEHHLQYNHVKYNCGHCKYQASKKSILRKHIKYQHEGMKLSCNECEYQASNPSSMALHIQSKHEGIRYTCDKCEFQTSFTTQLKRHIKVIHEGFRYACNQCGQQITSKNGLQKHIKNVHRIYEEGEMKEYQILS